MKNTAVTTSKAYWELNTGQCRGGHTSSTTTEGVSLDVEFFYYGKNIMFWILLDFSLGWTVSTFSCLDTQQAFVVLNILY